MHIRLRVDNKNELKKFNIETSPSFCFEQIIELVVYNCEFEIFTIYLLKHFKNLKSLSFMESSPSKLLLFLIEYCRKLEYLTLEGKQLSSEFLKTENNYLVDLRLINTGIKINFCLYFTKLRSFCLFDSNNEIFSSQNIEDINNLILNIPETIQEIEICVNSKFVNLALDLIGTRLTLLESLHLHLIDEVDPAPDITAQALQALQRGCPKLVTVQFSDGLVGFTSNAFSVFGKFARLRKISSLYDDPAISCLENVLQESNSIEEITFFECAEYIENDGGSGRWSEMEDELRRVHEKYPGVSIILKDWWWSK